MTVTRIEALAAAAAVFLQIEIERETARLLELTERQAA